MTKVLGYYNVNNKVFLGPMTSTNEATGVATTPRYVEGVCFGEYNTDTHEFIPHTNPMVVPKGSIVTVDEDPNAFEQGGHRETVTGIVEDKGADIAKKPIHFVNPERAQSKKKLIMPNKFKALDLDNLF